LRDFRRSQGHRADIWTSEDIEYTTQQFFDASAVRSMLQQASAAWTIKPRWVVIFSDHAVQPSGSRYFFVQDWKLLNPELGRWEDYIRGLWPYCDINDDNVGEIAVGRVAVSASYEIDAYVSKIIQHDTDVAARNGYVSRTMLVQDENIDGNDSL